MTANRPSSVPKVASSKRHFMLAPSGPGGSIQYACTNSAGGEPSTLSVPDSSQHSARCAISVRPIASGGNAGLKAATHAKVAAHAAAAARIGGVDRGLARGDVIKVGRTVELECLDTPGHTLAHICLLSRTQEPALFCGDTLFNAGAGN